MISISSISLNPLARIRKIYKDSSLKGKMTKYRSNNPINKKGPKEKGLGNNVDIYV